LDIIRFLHNNWSISSLHFSNHHVQLCIFIIYQYKLPGYVYTPTIGQFPTFILISHYTTIYANWTSHHILRAQGLYTCLIISLYNFKHMPYY
jgi:hypothetical protein